MSITAVNGPFVQKNSNTLGSAGTAGTGQNPDAGPSVFNHLYGLHDPRYPFTCGGTGGEMKLYGWMGGTLQTINAVPSTISAVNIAADQASTATLTLVSSTAAGITVGTSITRADTGATVTGLLAIDSAMTPVAFGTSGNVNMWDPSKAIARNVRITSGGNDSAKTFTVTGYDLYGYPMSEAITGANTGVASGAKAFKYISSITCSSATASNVSAGTGDVIGLPIRSDYVGNVIINYNNTLITASTGYTAAVTTSPATTTTGDVRGTYALQTASNNSRRLVVYQMVPASQIAPSVGLVAGLFSVAQNLANNNGT